MSYRRRRNRHRQQFEDTRDEPVLVARVAEEIEQRGASYEEARWAYLSPTFRRAHNRYRQARGLSTIPEPKIDRYRPSRLRSNGAFDPNSPEAQAVIRESLRRELMLPGGEGFHNRSTPANWRDP